jgi:acyl carrier protein
MEQLIEIITRVLNIENKLVDENLARLDSSNWDSFNHLLLISEIEKELGVVFTMQEVADIQNYKQLKEIIELRSNT